MRPPVPALRALPRIEYKNSREEPAGVVREYGRPRKACEGAGVPAAMREAPPMPAASLPTARVPRSPSSSREGAKQRVPPGSGWKAACRSQEAAPPKAAVAAAPARRSRPPSPPECRRRRVEGVGGKRAVRREQRQCVTRYAAATQRSAASQNAQPRENAESSTRPETLSV